MAKKNRKNKAVKDGKKNQKFMIYLVSAIMLLSAFFWMTRSVEVQPPAPLLSENNSNMIQYQVVPVGNASAIMEVERPLMEVAAIPLRPEYVRAEGVLEVLNTSFEGISETMVELSNAYMLFRFLADDVPTAFDSVRQGLGSIVGEVNVYRAYECAVGGGEIYLLSPDELVPGDKVRGILLERQDNFQTIGIQTERVVTEPVVLETVSVENITVSDDT
ncbi:MAG: hypothetical protein ABH851_04140 [Methanobacteriota archaeon]